MLARDAESLFWAGRYLERAEDTARLLDVTYHGMLETTPAEEKQAWRDVLSAVRLDQWGFRRDPGRDPVGVRELRPIDRLAQPGHAPRVREQLRDRDPVLPGHPELGPDVGYQGARLKQPSLEQDQQQRGDHPL